MKLKLVLNEILTHKNMSLMIILILCFQYSTLSINVINLSSALGIKKINIACLGHFSTEKMFYQTDIDTNIRMWDGSGQTQITQFTANQDYSKIECHSQNSFAVYSAFDQQFQEYNQQTQTLTYFSQLETPIDFTYCRISNNQNKLVYMTTNKISIVNSPVLVNPIINTFTFPSNKQLHIIKCTTTKQSFSKTYCFVVSQDFTKLLYFSLDKVSSYKERIVSKINSVIQRIKDIVISEESGYIYVGMDSGIIKQYQFRQDRNLLIFRRQTTVSEGFQISKLSISPSINQLFFINFQQSLSSIDISSSGSLRSNVDLNYLPFSISQGNLLLLNPDNALIYKINQYPHIQIIYQNTSLDSMNPKLQRICLNENTFFNVTNSQCQTCKVQFCIRCDQQRSVCYECQQYYYLGNDGLCKSCQFGGISSQRYSQCYDQRQMFMIQISDKIAPALTQAVGFSYQFLTSSALLFLFLRFINFWSIVSIYYFLQIEGMPYFLSDLLHQIFKILNGSVLIFFGIDVSQVKIGIDTVMTNAKFQHSIISTDFFQANFESIIIVGYSSIIICVVYYYFKNMMKKCDIYIFEKVRVQACMEECIGIFTPLLVPIYHFVEHSGFKKFSNKANSTLQFTFFGLVVIFPALYTIFIVKRMTMKQRLSEISKKLKTDKSLKGFQIDPKKTAKLIIIQETNMFKKQPWYYITFISQQEGQKLLYCLLAILVSFLVSFPYPFIFFGIVLTINFACLLNSFYAKKWRLNLILQKLILLVYHCCFIGMYIWKSFIFQFASAAVICLIIGGTHQLVTSLAEKVYFVYLICKQKYITNNKISNTFTIKEIVSEMASQIMKKQTFSTKNQTKSNQNLNEDSIELREIESKQNFKTTQKNISFTKTTKYTQETTMFNKSNIKKNAKRVKMKHQVYKTDLKIQETTSKNTNTKFAHQNIKTQRNSKQVPYQQQDQIEEIKTEVRMKSKFRKKTRSRTCSTKKQNKQNNQNEFITNSSNSSLVQKNKQKINKIQKQNISLRLRRRSSTYVQKNR